MKKMKPRYYVHMGPKAVEKVSCMWKAVHITIFFLLLCSSSIATACIYNILDMYKFHCILYAKVAFEQTYEERLKEIRNDTAPSQEPDDTSTKTYESTIDRSKNPYRDNEELQINNIEAKNYNNQKAPEEDNLNPDCVKDPTYPGCEERNIIGQGLLTRLKPMESNISRLPRFGERSIRVKLDFWNGLLRDWELKSRGHPGHSPNETVNQTSQANNTGFLNMRKTIFATIYMCDLMLFAPLASVIITIFLGALMGVAGKGGAGNPGDLLPNPWICVYPFLGLCAFMSIFSFVADQIYHKGLAVFCSRYYPVTKTKWCSEKMDKFNVQFSKEQPGSPKSFYMNYYLGSIGVQVTSALWVIQTLIYVFRILCLADFSVYLTRIKIKDGEKGDPKMAQVVWDMMDSKTKVP